MSLAVGVLRSASPADWSWPAFWFVAPFLLALILLTIVAVIALLRARREDVPTVFSAFGTSIVQVARRRPKQGASDTEAAGPGAARHTDEKARALNAASKDEH